MVPFDRQTWFSQHILVHEVRLRSYLRRFLKAHWEVADGVQETYARLLSLPDGALVDIRHPHAFLFTAARNVALEWIRRRGPVVRGPTAESSAERLLDDGPGPFDELAALEDLALLASAIAGLPERCRQVLTLRKLYGLPQKEIAARLGISENTVEKHAANGVRLCADYFRAAGRADARLAREPRQAGGAVRGHQAPNGGGVAPVEPARPPARACLERSEAQAHSRPPGPAEGVEVDGIGGIAVSAG